MLIEEILPINYYNQLIGILVDTTILKTLIQNYMPKLSEIIENNKIYEGNFIGDAFINKILVNLFINKNIDPNISLLILDYLFIKGNKIVFVAFLAIYQYLQDFIINGSKCIESYSYIINQDLKNLKVDNKEFLYNLFFKYQNSISKMKHIDETRNKLSTKISKSLEDNNLDFIKSKVKLAYSEELVSKQLDKFSKCNKKWPYCLMDSYFENVTRVVELLSFGKNEIKYIDNYFFEEKSKKKLEENDKIEEDTEKINYNLILERRPHFCSEIIEDMDSKHKEKEKESDTIQEENGIKENNIESNLNINESKKDKKLHLIKTIIQSERHEISKMIEDEIDKDGEDHDNDDE